MHNQFVLMKDRRFWPLFVTLFLGAFNDNLFKQTLSVMVAYGMISTGSQSPQVLVSLAAALFIIPFILFTPIAGSMADKFAKDKIIRVIKLAEICIVGMAFAGLYFQSVALLMLVLFSFGTHSAFMSPSKFSILPQHLRRDELIGGNALVNTGTYLAILGGTILGGLLALNPAGIAMAAGLLLVCALSGYLVSRQIPPAPPRAPELKLNFNPVQEAARVIGYARAQPPELFTAMLGSAWFFFTGAMLLAQFPNFAKQTLGVDNVVLTLFMVTFSLGVGLGGLLNNSLLRSRVEPIFVPAAALAIAVFALDLHFASAVYNGLPQINGPMLLGAGEFLSYWSGWRIVLDLLFISLAGGIYVVPLKSIIQDRAPLEHNARILAASSLLDALFVLSSAILAIIVFALGFRVIDLFILISIGSAAVAIYMMHKDKNNWVTKSWRRFNG